MNEFLLALEAAHADRLYGMPVSTEEYNKAKAALRPSEKIYSSQDGVLNINVLGYLAWNRNPWAVYCGYDSTGYSDIIEALDYAEKSDKIYQVNLIIDSPGGEVKGLFALLDRLDNFQKPVTSLVDSACSAAYAIASKGKEIIALSASSQVGSIGVVTTMYSFSCEHTICSTEAPDKRPDPSTDEGKQKIRAYLDQIHELFAGHIASGRGITVDKVNSDYGRGAVFLASSALSSGLIDFVKDQKEESEALSYDEGVSAERNRVISHLSLAETSGDFKTALEAIKAGSEVTAELTQKHMLFAIESAKAEAIAKIESSRQEDRKSDEPELSGTPDATSTMSFEDQMIAYTLELRGIKS